jgi:hypothetical protein
LRSIIFLALVFITLPVIGTSAFAEECPGCDIITLGSSYQSLVSGAGCPCLETPPGADCAHSGIKYTREVIVANDPDSEPWLDENGNQLEDEALWIRTEFTCTCVNHDIIKCTTEELMLVPLCVACVPAIGPGINDE